MLELTEDSFAQRLRALRNVRIQEVIFIAACSDLMARRSPKLIAPAIDFPSLTPDVSQIVGTPNVRSAFSVVNVFSVSEDIKAPSAS